MGKITNDEMTVQLKEQVQQGGMPYLLENRSIKFA